MKWNTIILLLLVVLSMTNSYNRPKCGGITKKRKKLYSTRRRGKRRTQVHEKCSEKTKTPPKESPTSPTTTQVHEERCVFNQTLVDVDDSHHFELSSF